MWKNFYLTKMSIPNLNFEIQHFQDFLNSESKLGWLRQSLFLGENIAELQLSILGLFVVKCISTAHTYANAPPKECPDI